MLSSIFDRKKTITTYTGWHGDKRCIINSIYNIQNKYGMFEGKGITRSDAIRYDWVFYQVRLNDIDCNEILVVPQLPKRHYSFTYATEADVLNMAMFGQTAKQWIEAHTNLDGNIRDHATLQQLIVLSNMESLNAEMIKRGIQRNERVVELHQAPLPKRK